MGESARVPRLNLSPVKTSDDEECNVSLLHRIDGMPCTEISRKRLSDVNFLKENEDDISPAKRKVLFDCVIRGDASATEELLMNDSFLVKAIDHSGMSALHVACRYVHADVVKVLLKYNSDPNLIGGREKWAPLHYASKYFMRDFTGEGDIDSSRMATREIVDKLCDSKANTDVVDDFGCTPLHYAAIRGNSEAAKALISHNADTTILDAHQMSAFMTSCAHGSEEVFDVSWLRPHLVMQAYNHKRLLLEGQSEQVLFTRSDKTLRDRRKNTCLHIVAQHGHTALMEKLLSGGLPSSASSRITSDSRDMLRAVNNERKTAFQLAVEADHCDVVKILLMHYEGHIFNRRERMLLHHACEQGFLDIVKVLVDSGKFSVNEEDDRGWTPAHSATMHDHVDVLEYVLSKNEEKMEAADNDGKTPILIAAIADAIQCLKLLIRKRAKFEVVDKEGRNIIYLAAKYDAVQVLDYMLKALSKRDTFYAKRQQATGAGRLTSEQSVPYEEKKKRMIDKMDIGQETAMHCVCSNGYIQSVRLLHSHGAAIDYINDDEETPLHLAAAYGNADVVEQLIEWDKKLCLAKDDLGMTPLHRAAKSDATETDVMNTVAVLAKHSDVNAKDVYDLTPLHHAIASNKLAVVKILIERGGSAEPSDDIGCTTPLHLAAREGHASIVQYLLGTNISINRRDENDKNALELAIDGNHKEVARILIAQHDWESLFKNHGIIPLNRTRDARNTVMRKLIHKFPDIASLAFDRCITMIDEGENKPLYQRIKYEYVDDTWVLLSDEKKELLCGANPYDKEGRLLDNARPYCENFDAVYANHPLRTMVNSEHEKLLSHALIRSLLKHKWNSMGRYVYYTGLCIYILFITFFTVFIVHSKAPYNVRKEDGVSLYWTDDDFDNHTCDSELSIRSLVTDVSQYVVLILAGLQIIKEGYQFYARKGAYLTWENFLEITIYLSAALVVFDFGECSWETGIRHKWQWHLASVSVFLQWLNLLMLVRKLPKFGIYVVMFMDILKTFSRFSLIFGLFVVAFSITFFVVLQNREEFSSLPSSILKTTVMMIGEFEFTAIFHGDQSVHTEHMYSRNITYPIFLVFAVVMTILLMNLLVGLAVDDIKSVQEKAALKRLSMQVDLVLQVECSILNRIRRKAARQFIDIRQKEGLLQRFRAWFGRSDGTDDSGMEAEAFNKTDSELLLERELNLQKLSLSNLQSNIDAINSKQVKMEEMLQKILDIISKKEPGENDQSGSQDSA